MSTIRAQGFPAPTPIQCQAWPMALSGRDVVAIAQTGSGKTIAFALPGMLHINACVASGFHAPPIFSDADHYLSTASHFLRLVTVPLLSFLPQPVN